MSPVQGVAQRKATAEHCKGVLRDEESHEADETAVLSKKTPQKNQGLLEDRGTAQQERKPKTFQPFSS